ncbi:MULTISPECIES: hypothetical protein [unclassified Microbacterium]|uniref:SDH family Clp fold serine proteinase n=1 Tax=unclassified Microbacterium TaxID=2609290 RepID=UPI000B2879BF|nr:MULTISPECIES: hypothetical protein [unclassified Microbacterium]MBN9215537.1 hypothetical protein [Microbacterium sp.]
MEARPSKKPARAAEPKPSAGEPVQDALPVDEPLTADDSVDDKVRSENADGASDPVDESTSPADWDVLMLLQMGPGANSSLMRPVVQDIIQRLGGLDAPREPGSRIDVWLDSPGGDAHAAYKLGLYLRSRFEVVNFVIVDYAKSAATLLALAGDEIFMGPAAELGPLDTQESREGEVRMRSNLDTANTIDNVYFQVVSNAIAAGSEILRSTALTREQTIQHVLDFSAQFARPLLEQIDLVAVNAASTSLDVAIEYGARLLSYRHNRTGFASAKARMSQLVRGYPTHGYVIDRDEARDGLGLPVKNLEDYGLLSQLDAVYAGAQSQQMNIIEITKASAIVRVSEEEEHVEPEAGTEPGAA